MKRLLVCASLLAATVVFAQQGPPKSPPATERATIGGKTITISYSSPRVNGRAGNIFTKGGLISTNPGYPVWRAGANAATLLATDGGITASDLDVPKGSYTLFVDISNPESWVLIISKQTGQWGLRYDKSQDLGRVKMTMSKPSSMVENLKYTLTDLGHGKGTLSLEWENYKGTVSIVAH